MRGARPLSQGEVKKAMSAFDGKYAQRNKGLFQLSINIGTRISELLGLNVGDVWQFNRPVKVLSLKNGNCKGKKSRAIPINNGAKQAIVDLILWKKDNDMDTSPKAPLFETQKGCRMTRQTAHDVLKDVFRKLKLTGNVSTHSLRKTVGTELMNSDIPLPVIQEILGHTSLENCRKYLGVGADQLAKALSMLGY